MTKAHQDYWGSLTEQERADRVAHFKTDEFQAKATEGKRQESHRQQKSEIAKDRWQDPKMDDIREELRLRFEGFKTDKVVLGKISRKAKDRWQDPAYREKGLKQVGEASKKAAELLKSDPVKYAERLALLAAGREAAAKALRGKWQDPEFRARRVAQMKLPRKRRDR
jgi:hypothetical protein